MSDSEVVVSRQALIAPRARDHAKSQTSFRERRRAPRPRLAEIRLGAKFNLLPPIVVTGAVRMIEFLLVAALGFAIYVGYVENAHMFYLVTVLTAAGANTLMLQAFDLYSVPALSAFVRSFTRLARGLDGGHGRSDGRRLSRQSRRRLLPRVDLHLVSGGPVRAVRRKIVRVGAGQALDPGGPSQSPGRDRGRRQGGGRSDQGAGGLDRHRHPHRRHFRRSRQ